MEPQQTMNRQSNQVKEQSQRYHTPRLETILQSYNNQKSMLLAQNTHTQINEMEEIGEGDYEVQTSNYKINKSQRCNVHIGNTVNNIVTAQYGDG